MKHLVTAVAHFASEGMLDKALYKCIMQEYNTVNTCKQFHIRVAQA